MEAETEGWATDPYLQALVSTTDALKAQIERILQHGDHMVPEQIKKEFVDARWKLAIIENHLTKAVDSIAVPGLSREIHAEHDRAHARRFLNDMSELEG